MRSKSCFLAITKILVVLTIAGMCHSVHAVLINFDDLTPATIPENGILTNEYEAKGILFTSSPYVIKSSIKSAPYYVSGPGLGFKFVDDLPTYVSFYTGSSMRSKVFIEAVGPNGYFERVVTEGEINGMSDMESTPYIPNQFIVLKSEFGISAVSLSGQATAYIDDLSFYYAGEAVPEPSSAVIIMLGVLCILWRQINLPHS